MACCSSATWHVALTPVPPDDCDDSGVFDCGARHHAERLSTGAAPHAGPRRGMRHSCRCPQMAARTVASSSASRRAAFDRGNTSSCALATRHVALMPVPLDGCDDSVVFDCGAWHRAKRLLTGAATLAAPRQRGTRHSWRCLQVATIAAVLTAGLGIAPSGLSTLHLRLRSSAPRRVDFSRAAPRAASR